MRLHKREIEGLSPTAPTLRGVHAALQRAIELEHATIPAYLYAYYSLDRERNARAAGILKSVAVEEMGHMVMAANVLTALGGHPAISTPRFVPRYPGPLPGGVEGQLTVGLRRLDRAQLAAFITLEEPRHHLADAPDDTIGSVTIGEFYLSIAAAIRALGDDAFSGHPSHQVGPDLMYGAVIVSDVESALASIEVIVEQGEGTGLSPLEIAGFGGNDVAHYYRLMEIYEGRTLRADPSAPDGYTYSGEPVSLDLEGVYALPDSPTSLDYPAGSSVARLNNEFNETYTRLLETLQHLFNAPVTGPAFGAALGLMEQLDSQARLLVAEGVAAGVPAGPTFEYVTFDQLPPIP
ncbi:MAG: ferritin-like domain-containing protein [Acidimicrobiales bacterium]